MNDVLSKLDKLVRYSWEGGYCRDDLLFRLYQEARLYDLTGSQIDTRLGEMLYAIEDGKSKDSKDYFVEKITTRWDAWRYAFKQLDAPEVVPPGLMN